MTTINDKVLKAIFGSTKEEAAAELAVLQSKGAAWSAAGALAAEVALTVPAGSIVVPVLGYEYEPAALVVEVVYIDVLGVSEHTVAGNVWANPTVSNFTPFEGGWNAWRLAREASHAQAALGEAQAAAAIKRLEGDQIVLAKQAEQQADSVRQQHVRWFTEAYRAAVYKLWSEEFLEGAEKDAFLKVFDTKGKLRDATEATLALMAKVMGLCPEPENAGIDPTEKHVTEVADVIASWVNGDLDIAIPTA